MMSSLSEVQITETIPFPTKFIDSLLAKFGVEQRSSLLGDSVAFTREDIEERLNRVSQFMEFANIMKGMSSFSSLMWENVLLRQEIEQVKQRLSELVDRIPEEKVIILKEISREEAKQEIRQLFSTGRTLYYSDIVKELRLDLEVVVDICNELQESGEISIDAGVS